MGEGVAPAAARLSRHHFFQLHRQSTRHPYTHAHPADEQGANLSELDTLVAVAGELGLPQDEARQYLEQDRGRDAVLRDDARGKRE